MRGRSRAAENALDIVYRRNVPAAEAETVILYLEHRGVYDRLAQRVFGRPAVSRISLDELGSFIWRHIDGERSVYEIGQCVEAEYRERAQPLYTRLLRFLYIMEQNGLITRRE